MPHYCHLPYFIATCHLPGWHGYILPAMEYYLESRYITSKLQFLMLEGRHTRPKSVRYNQAQHTSNPNIVIMAWEKSQAEMPN